MFRMRLSIGNAIAEIRQVNDAVEEALDRAAAPPALVPTAHTVIDELLSNVIKYGYADDRPHRIDVAFRIDPEGLTLQFEDDGVRFDPFSRSAPDTTGPLEERSIGGMGIHLVRQLSSACRYERVGDRNVVTVTIPMPGRP